MIFSFFFSSYFSWSLKSVLLSIGNFLGWLTYESEFSLINKEGFSTWFWFILWDDGESDCKPLITGWTNANGFFLDIDGEEFSFVIFDCDIDWWLFIGYDSSDV